MTEYLHPLPPPNIELEVLENKKWDLLDELNIVNIAIAALKNKLKGETGK